MKPFLARLEISSFTDIGSIGAEHYYGKVVFPYELKIDSVELEHPLSQKEALHLNKKDNCKFVRYRPGQLSNKFETKEQIIKIGVEFFKNKYPENLLCLGDNKPLVYWPKNLDNLAKKINNVAMEYEKLKWLRNGFYFVCENEEKEIKLSREWRELIKEYER